MVCTNCGKQQNKYNTSKLCYACDDLVDDWDEAVRLPDAEVWESYPPPMDGENVPQYVRRLLVHTSGAVPIYQIASYYNIDKRKIDSAIGNAKRWFERRGCRLLNDKRGGGYRVVQCSL